MPPTSSSIAADVKILLESSNTLLKALFDKKGLKGSRIKARTKIVIKNGKIQLITLDYFKFVDRGRGAGKPPPVAIIADWIKRKKIKIPSGYNASNFAYAVAKSIGERGTKGKDLMPSIGQIMRNLTKQYIRKIIRKEIKL